MSATAKTDPSTYLETPVGESDNNVPGIVYPDGGRAAGRIDCRTVRTVQNQRLALEIADLNGLVAGPVDMDNVVPVQAKFGYCISDASAFAAKGVSTSLS